MTHTPEPWKVKQHGNGNELFGGTSPQSQWYLFEEATESNAARIVACVNACKGLTNSELETLPAFKYAIAFAIEHYNEVMPDVQNWLQTGSSNQLFMRYNLDMYLALQAIANALSDKVSLSIDDHNGFAFFKRK